MMGLSEIVKANENPEEHAKGKLSAGQRRRNDKGASSFWSDGEAVKAVVAAIPDHTPELHPVYQPTAADYKPTHGGYPIPQDDDWGRSFKREAENIAEMQVAPRVVADVVRDGNGKPPMYFDALRLWRILDMRATTARDRADGVKNAMREMQNAVSESDVRLACSNLGSLVSSILDGDDGSAIKAEIVIDEIANAVDVIAPPNPKGYVPHMGLHYAMKPIRSILSAFKQVDA